MAKRGRPKKTIPTIVKQVNQKYYKISEYIFSIENGLNTSSSPQTGEFSNIKELFNLPWIKPYVSWKDLGRFSISKHADYNYLMVENSKGNWWWILAKLPKNFECDLPSFKFRMYLRD
jgi:hypothetical protein